MGLWNEIAENEAGSIVESGGRYRVYEKTDVGTSRVGVYSDKSEAMDVYNNL